MRPGTVIAGRFELEALAGSGGMGVVYRALDRTSGERVALKVLVHQGDHAVLRFEREARVLEEVRHPGVVRHVAHGRTEQGALYLAMEWLEGESLEARLARGPLGVAESVALATRVAEALGAAHARGIVHRDVKPANVFLEGGGVDRVRLLDFGIARLMADSSATRTGLLLGTPGYIAPEQAKGARELDARADVYSLGCVLFECLTGRPAFIGEQPLALLAKILLEDTPRAIEVAPHVPAELDELLARMVAKEPEARPRDGRAVAQELASAARRSLPPARAAQASATAITADEQRLVTIVLASPPSRAPGDRSPRAALDRIAVEVARLGGVLHAMLDGSCLVALGERSGARDGAILAARAALDLSFALGDAPIAIATGRAELGERAPVGEVIERAARILAATPRGSIRVDDVTAGLVDARFEIVGAKGELELSAERDGADAARTVLGKPTSCVGRDGDLARLLSLLDAAIAEERAAVALVTAPAGQGKTRLLQELLARVERRAEPVDVWIGRGDPARAGSPFGLLAPALRRAAGVLEGEPLDVRRDKLRAFVARVVPGDAAARVTTFLGELVGVPFPDDDDLQLRAARRDPMLMGDRMARAFEELVAASCRARPLLVVLEDLHQGDLPSVRFVDGALRNVRDAPLFVLALARPEVSELFPRLFAERELTQVSLGALGKRASERLVREVLGETAPAEVVARIVARAAGNPFYLEELVRAEAEGAGDAPPATVLAMVEARLERLEADARRVLRAASLFGQRFWRGGVAALLGEGSAAVVDAWLPSLVDRELLVESPEARFAGEREYAFRHALVHEAAYGMLTDEDRALGHRLAGAWLDAAGESEAVVVAEHYERGGEPARAVAPYVRAGVQALEGNDVAAAIARAERGIACGAAGEERAALRLVEAEAHGWRGENAEAQRAALDAMAHADPGGDAWTSSVGHAAGSSGRLADVARLGELIDALHRSAFASQAPSRAAVIAGARAAMTALVLGRTDLAAPLLADLAAAPAELAEADPTVAAWLHRTAALEAYLRHDTAGYLEGSRRAAESFELAGDLRGASLQRVSVGYAHLELGEHAEAEEALSGALASAERLGLAMVAANARHNLGLALARMGRLDEALDVERRAIAECAAQGDLRLEGGSRMYLATILLLAGDLDAAEAEARAAAERLVPMPPLRARALATLAEALRARGRAAEALAEAELAVEVRAPGEAVDASEVAIHLAYAEALAACGLTERARAAIAVARERVIAAARAIGDEARRASFLVCVPENARALALAANWLA